VHYIVNRAGSNNKIKKKVQSYKSESSALDEMQNERTRCIATVVDCSKCCSCQHVCHICASVCVCVCVFVCVSFLTLLQSTNFNTQIACVVYRPSETHCATIGRAKRSSTIGRHPLPPSYWRSQSLVSPVPCSSLLFTNSLVCKRYRDLTVSKRKK